MQNIIENKKKKPRQKMQKDRKHVLKLDQKMKYEKQESIIDQNVKNPKIKKNIIDQQLMSQIKNIPLPCSTFRSRADSSRIHKAHSIQNLVLVPLPVQSQKGSIEVHNDNQNRASKDQLMLGPKLKSSDSSIQLKQALQKHLPMKSSLKSLKAQQTGSNIIQDFQKLTINGGQIFNARQTTFSQNNSLDPYSFEQNLNNIQKIEKFCALQIKNESSIKMSKQNYTSQARHLVPAEKFEITFENKNEIQINHKKFAIKKRSVGSENYKNIKKQNPDEISFKNTILPSNKHLNIAGNKNHLYENNKKQIQYSSNQNQESLTNISTTLCLNMIKHNESIKKQETFRNNQNLKPGKLIKSSRTKQHIRAQIEQQKKTNMQNPIIQKNQGKINLNLNYQSLQNKTTIDNKQLSKSIEDQQINQQESDQSNFQIDKQKNVKSKLIVPKSTQNVKQSSYSKYFESNNQQNLNDYNQNIKNEVCGKRYQNDEKLKIQLPGLQKNIVSSASNGSRIKNQIQQAGQQSNSSRQINQSINSSRQTNRISIPSIRSQQTSNIQPNNCQQSKYRIAFQQKQESNQQQNEEFKQDMSIISNQANANNKLDQKLQNLIIEQQKCLMMKRNNNKTKNNKIQLKKTIDIDESHNDLQDTTMNSQRNSQLNSISKLNKPQFINQQNTQVNYQDLSINNQSIEIKTDSSKKQKNHFSNHSSPAKINKRKVIDCDLMEGKYENDSLENIIVESRISQHKIKQELQINDDSLNFDSSIAPSFVINNPIKDNHQDIFINYQNQYKNQRYQSSKDEEEFLKEKKEQYISQQNLLLPQILQLYPFIYQNGFNKFLQISQNKKNLTKLLLQLQNQNQQQENLKKQNTNKVVNKENKNKQISYSVLQNKLEKNEIESEIKEHELLILRKQIAELEKQNCELRNVLENKNEIQNKIKERKQKQEPKKKKYPLNINKEINKDLNHLNISNEINNESYKKTEQNNNGDIFQKKESRVLSEDLERKNEIQKSTINQKKSTQHSKKGSQHIQKKQYFNNGQDMKNNDHQNILMPLINQLENQLQNNYNSNQSIEHLQNRNLQTFQSSEFANHNNKKVVMSSGNQSGYLQRRMKPLIQQNPIFFVNLQSQNFQNSKSNFNAIQNPRIVSQDLLFNHQQASNNPIQLQEQMNYNECIQYQKSRARSSGINISRKYQLLNQQMINIQYVDKESQFYEQLDKNQLVNRNSQVQKSTEGNLMDGKIKFQNNFTKAQHINIRNIDKSEDGAGLQQTSLDKISNILSMNENYQNINRNHNEQNQPSQSSQFFMSRRQNKMNLIIKPNDLTQLNFKNKYEMVRRQLNQTEVHQYQSNSNCSNNEFEEYICEDNQHNVEQQQYLSIKKKQNFDVASDQHQYFKHQQAQQTRQNIIQESLSGSNVIYQKQEINLQNNQIISNNLCIDAMQNSFDNINEKLNIKQQNKKITNLESNCINYREKRKNKKSCGWLVDVCSDIDQNYYFENKNEVNEKQSIQYQEDDIKKITLQTNDQLNNTIQSIQQNMELFVINKNIQQFSGEQTLKAQKNVCESNDDGLQEESSIIDQFKYNLQAQYNSQNIEDANHKLQKKQSIKQINEDDPILSNSAQVNASNQRKLILNNNRATQKSELDTYQQKREIQNYNNSHQNQQSVTQNLDTQTQKSQFDLTFSGHMHSAEQNSYQIQKDSQKKEYSCKEFQNKSQAQIQMQKLNKIIHKHQPNNKGKKQQEILKIRDYFHESQSDQNLDNVKNNQQQNIINQLQKISLPSQPKVGRPPHQTVEINKQKKFKCDQKLQNQDVFSEQQQCDKIKNQSEILNENNQQNQSTVIQNKDFQQIMNENNISFQSQKKQVEQKVQNQIIEKKQTLVNDQFDIKNEKTRQVNMDQQNINKQIQMLARNEIHKMQNSGFGEISSNSVTYQQITSELNNQSQTISTNSYHKPGALSIIEKHTQASDNAQNMSNIQNKQISQVSNKILISLSDSKNDLDSYFIQNQNQVDNYQDEIILACKKSNQQNDEICPLATFGNLNFVGQEDFKPSEQIGEKRNSQKIFQNNLEKCMNQSMSSNGAQSGNFNLFNNNGVKNNINNPRNSLLNKKRFPKDFFVNNEKKDL